MGADWTAMIDRAGEFFPILIVPTAILFGLALTFRVLDFLISLVGGGDGGEAPDPGYSASSSSARRAPRPGRPGRQSWRDEPYTRSDSWDELEDNARRVNNYKG